VVLSRTSAVVAVSSLERKVFGVGGRVLLMQGWVWLNSGERVITVFKAVGRCGLRGGKEGEGVVVALVWAFSGDGGGAGRADGMVNGFAETAE